MKDKKEVCVFVSQPNNMREERDLVESIVNRINKSFDDDGFNVVLNVKRWEDLSPSAGNTQEIIN